jgi:hypothetical protein
MRRLGSTSWQVSVGRGNQIIVFALWLRAAEGIEVPPDPFVPGPLDHEVAAQPTNGSDLGPAWLGWWRDLIGLPVWTFERSDGHPLELDLDSPDPMGLARWPELQAVVRQRWPEAQEWRQSGPGPAGVVPSPTVSSVAQEVERELGRPLRPFSLDLVLLPVRDTTVRRVSDERYLVPERVFDGLRGARWLTELLRQVG